MAAVAQLDVQQAGYGSLAGSVFDGSSAGSASPTGYGILADYGCPAGHAGLAGYGSPTGDGISVGF